MIKRLTIENFALVERLEIAFEDKLNVLTGETGAGKSIIVGAIAKLLGEKADKDDIRSGTGLAIVEADFALPGHRRLFRMLEQLDIETENDTITLRREIPASRASRSFVNGRLINLAQLRLIADQMAELFGQHSHQLLLDEKNHADFLDRTAGLTEKVNDLAGLYERWEKAGKKLAEQEANRKQSKDERELLRFQKDEIEKGKIRIGEEYNLLQEKKILDSSQVLGDKAGSILNRLDGDGITALDLLDTCRRELTEMAALDDSLQEKEELIDQAIINLEELRTEIETYLSSIPNDPERLEQINLRLDEIYHLRKKYGGSEEAILDNLARIENRLADDIDVDDRIEQLRKDEDRLRRLYTERALLISHKRKEAAGKLSTAVKKELARLGIESARFRAELVYTDDPGGIEIDGRTVRPGPGGLESCRLFIAANPGEPLKPLAKTASGGEISRIMLALKAADRKVDSGERRLLVFDEIDTGIGGRTAVTVAERLARLADDFQLLVVTHLHQIAAASHHHFAVEKGSSGSKTGRKTIRIRKLRAAEKKKEIERMISLPNLVED